MKPTPPKKMNTFEETAFKVAKRLAEIFLFLDKNDSNTVQKAELMEVYKVFGWPYDIDSDLES